MEESTPVSSADYTESISIQHVVNAAAAHDIERLKSCIDTYVFHNCKVVDVQDESNRNTPLHAAIASCAPDSNRTGLPNGVPTSETGEATVRFLLENGAIWNQLNKNDMTPGCIAFELGLLDLYQLMVDAGVRAELLLNRLDEYDQLSEEEDDNDDAEQWPTDSGLQNIPPGIAVREVPGAVDAPPEAVNGTHYGDVSKSSISTPGDMASQTYLSSTLSMSDSEILDEQQNGVMMAWEKGIMAKSADAILSSPGLRVLNIGFGMGIIDSLIQSHFNKPAEHHIVEAHPDVLIELERTGWRDKPGVFIHGGRWQDVLPTMMNAGLVFDALYYDTFAESYKDFKEFFSEHLLGLLDSAGRWSYFNGMGADRQISYDVYQKVVEMDLLEAGYDVEWQDVELPDFVSKEWEAVRRRYWNVEKYRLPVCKFLD